MSVLGDFFLKKIKRKVKSMIRILNVGHCVKEWDLLGFMVECDFYGRGAILMIEVEL